MGQALFITIAGMGGVFAFLLMMVFAMKLLSFAAKDDDYDEVAVAIAYAGRGK